MKSFRTEKGTELPILNLRGKDYLEVKYRIVWFREIHPLWTIETQILAVTEKSALVKATIRNDAGHTIATSHKQETLQGFPDFIEKSETGAIGRALALCGFGTQFAGDDLDEKDRIVDSPIQARTAAPKIPLAAPSTSPRAQVTSISPTSRVDLGGQIMRQAKEMGLQDIEILEWADSLCGKKALKDLTLQEMQDLLADMRRDSSTPPVLLPKKIAVKNNAPEPFL